jgi:acyl-coenzyme A synthetase/AMP-(fatty) acid ligase
LNSNVALPQLPSKFNITAACVDKWVESGRGQAPAVRLENRSISFSELQESINRLGNGLRGLDLGEGDRFLIRLAGGLLFYVSFLAGLKIGAVPIPTPQLLGKRELAHIIRTANVKLVITADELAEPIRTLSNELAHPPTVLCHGTSQSTEVELESVIDAGDDTLVAARTTPNDPAFMLFSSGTTGSPKGIAHAHRAFNLAAGDPVGRVGMGLSSDDIVLHVHDPAWSYSLGCGFLFPLHEGASIVATTERIHPREVLNAVEKHSVSILACVPTYYRAVLANEDAENERDLSSLRYCLSAGEPLTTATFFEWRARIGVAILDHIGQGEASMFCANTPADDPRPGSLGKPLPGYDVAVVNDEGSRVVGEVGHLVISDDNPGLFYDYLKMPEKWSETHRNGWYYTGDLAREDAEGYFWYVSRADDLITSRGYLISPAEVEDTLVDHPDVLEAGVVGHPHEKWGQVVTAYVALKNGIAESPQLESTLNEHVLGQLAPFKAPKRYFFVSELPKTSTGKIRRTELRAAGSK